MKELLPSCRLAPGNTSETRRTVTRIHRSAKVGGLHHRYERRAA